MSTILKFTPGDRAVINRSYDEGIDDDTKFEGRQGSVTGYSYQNMYVEVDLDGEDEQFLFNESEIDSLVTEDSDLKEALNKIDAMIDDIASDIITFLKLQQEAAPAIVKDDWNSDALALAVLHQRPVKFSYDKGNGTIEERTVTPESGFVNKHEVRVIVGHDHNRNDTRAFRLDRIQGDVSIH